MRKDKIEVYIHLMWTTYGRNFLLTPEIEKTLFPLLISWANVMTRELWLSMVCPIIFIGWSSFPRPRFCAIWQKPQKALLLIM